MADKRLRAFLEFIIKGDRQAKKALTDTGAAAEKVGTGAQKGAKGLKAMDIITGNFIAGNLLKAQGALINFGLSSIQAASDVEEMQAKFDTVFRDGAAEVEEQLTNMAKTLKRSRFDLMEYAATFQDTFVPLGFARDEAAKLSVKLVQLAEDLASFNNLDSATVARDLQTALVGNTEVLRKYGVVAQETQIKQEALNLGIWDGTGAISAQAKANAILSLTIKGTTDAQGDAERTSDSFANTMKGLQAAITDLKVELGTEFLPVATEAIDKATEWVEAMRPAIKLVRGDFVQGIEELTAANAAVIVTLEQQTAALLTAVAAYEEASNIVGKFSGLQDATQRGVKEVTDGIARQSDTYEEFIDKLKLASGETFTLFNANGQLILRSKEYDDVTIGSVSSISKLITKTQEIAREQARFGDMEDKLLLKTIKLKREQELLAQAEADGISVVKELTDAEKARRRELEKYALALTGNKDVARQYAQVEGELADKILLTGLRLSEGEALVKNANAAMRLRILHEEEAAEAAEAHAAALMVLQEAQRELDRASGQSFSSELAFLQELEAAREAGDTDRVAQLTESQRSLNEVMFESAQAAGASADKLAAMALGFDLADDGAVELALNMALIQAKSDELAQSYLDGTVSVEGMRQMMGRFVSDLQGGLIPGAAEAAAEVAELGLQATNASGSYEMRFDLLDTGEAIDTELGKLQVVDDTVVEPEVILKGDQFDEGLTARELRMQEFEDEEHLPILELDKEPFDENMLETEERIDDLLGLSPYEIQMDAETEQAETDVQSLETNAKHAAGDYFLTFHINTTGSIPSPSGGSGSGVGGQHGLSDFIVPAGFPNDSFIIAASSHERVNIETGPQQQSIGQSGGGSGEKTVNNFFPQTEAAMALALAQVHNNKRRRMSRSMGG